MSQHERCTILWQALQWSRLRKQTNQQTFQQRCFFPPGLLAGLVVFCHNKEVHLHDGRCQCDVGINVEVARLVWCWPSCYSCEPSKPRGQSPEGQIPEGRGPEGQRAEGRAQRAELVKTADYTVTVSLMVRCTYTMYSRMFFLPTRSISQCISTWDNDHQYYCTVQRMLASTMHKMIEKVCSASAFTVGSTFYIFVICHLRRGAYSIWSQVRCCSQNAGKILLWLYGIITRSNHLVEGVFAG
jgi:hypothetical protein